MKRLSCTVRDKRGFRGYCMTPDKNGDYVLYSDYLKLKQQYDKLVKQIPSKYLLS